MEKLTEKELEQRLALKKKKPLVYDKIIKCQFSEVSS